MNVSLAELETVQKSSHCLLNASEVEAMLDQLALDITACCQHTNPVILCVMTGAVVAVGRLLPRLNFALELDYIHVTRYGARLTGGELSWKQLPTTSLRDRVVVVIDDVLDEGITMAKIKAYCVEQGATSCYSAVLVDKKITKQKPEPADFVGYYAGSQYLYGLGMDYKGYLRNTSGLYACADNLEGLLCQN